MKSKIPLYDTLNIQLRGYDYPVLESYQKFLHNLIKNMDISFEDSWAVPPQKFQILRLKPKSNIVDSEYKLNLCQRTIQVRFNSVNIQLELYYSRLPHFYFHNLKKK